MDKKWIRKPLPEQDQIIRLGGELNLNPYLTTILLQRGVSTVQRAHDYFRPSLSQLHDPFLMRDMDRAVERLKSAIDRNEKGA